MARVGYVGHALRYVGFRPYPTCSGEDVRNTAHNNKAGECRAWAKSCRAHVGFSTKPYMPRIPLSCTAYGERKGVSCRVCRVFQNFAWRVRACAYTRTENNAKNPTYPAGPTFGGPSVRVWWCSHDAGIFLPCANEARHDTRQPVAERGARHWLVRPMRGDARVLGILHRRKRRREICTGEARTGKTRVFVYGLCGVCYALPDKAQRVEDEFEHNATGARN